MRLYSGIDLHSTNSVIGIIDENGKRLFNQKISNDLDIILKLFNPFKQDLESIVVESTYNWYWLVDGLMENGYQVNLANPAAIQQYSGLKYTDDKSDAFWLAEMKRLGILFEGYIYPKEERQLRDLLRRRLIFVRQRTCHILSLQSLFSRNKGVNLPGSMIKRSKLEDILKLIKESPDHLKAMVSHSLEAIKFLDKKVAEIEKEVKSSVKLKREFINLKTIPGIGDILGLTIMLEVGDINRFKKVGNYCSYCRVVKSEKRTNNKKKGKGNVKNGNKYLAWAYVEAANFSKRYNQKIQQFYQKKKAKTKNVIAVKALANKLARASYYVMKNQETFSEEKLFG